MELYYWEIKAGPAIHSGCVWAADEKAAIAAGFALCDQQFSLTDRGLGVGTYDRQYDRASLMGAERGGPAVLITTDWGNRD